MRIERSPVASTFRFIEPDWRGYINYARLAAQNGDEDMVKLLKCYDDLTPKERRQVMPEQLCDRAGVLPQDLIGAVTSQLWLVGSGAAKVISAIEHPKVVKTVAELAQLPHPDHYKERELHFRATGSLPDKKGSAISINVHNQPQTANFNGSGIPNMAVQSGYKRLEDDIADTERMLGDGKSGAQIIEMPTFADEEELTEVEPTNSEVESESDVFQADR